MAKMELIRGPWTRIDIKYLRKHYRNEPTSDVAEGLYRPKQAVRKMASRLGIYKTKKYLRAARLRKGPR